MIGARLPVGQGSNIVFKDTTFVGYKSSFPSIVVQDSYTSATIQNCRFVSAGTVTRLYLVVETHSSFGLGPIESYGYLEIIDSVITESGATPVLLKGTGMVHSVLPFCKS